MKRADYSHRFRTDLRILVFTLGAVAIGGVAFRLTKVRLFAAAIYVAVGLYVIRFCRLAYSDPDETIGAWRSHFWHLRPGSAGSRRFLRGLSIIGLFGGSLLLIAPLPLWYSAADHRGIGFALIGCSAVAAFLLRPAIRH
jgi:hypothetical protein